MTRPRVLLADHAATRLGMRIALGDHVTVCGEASDVESAIAESSRTQPDVCLIGQAIPGGGVEAVRGICEAVPGISVILLADQPDVEDLLEALRAGAIGYVPGGVDAGRLRRIVEAVSANEAAVPRFMVLDLIEELRGGGLAGADRLTGREVQVLGMLRRGRSTSGIAERLGISQVTVRRHISELVRKVGVASRSDLVAPSK